MHLLPVFLSLFLALLPTLADASYCSFPSAKNTTSVSSTIMVSGTVNFQYARLVATSSLRSSCDLNGSANGKHIIQIKDGGKVQNLILGDPAKGIWCEGTCTLENVYWEKVCYHAAGFAGGSSSETHTVSGGAAQNAPDKFFTQSSQGTTIIKNFCGEKFGKIYCSCGSGCNPQYKRSVQMSNSKFKGPGLTLISLNRNYGDSMSISGITVDGFNSASTKIKYGCQEYDGTTSNPSTMSPYKSYATNVAASGTSCKYSTSSIKINS